MPLQFEENPAEKFVVLRVRGKLTLAECLTLRPRLEECLRRRHSLRILLDMEKPHGWKLGAVWESLRFELAHYATIDRIAVLGGNSRERLLTWFHWFFTSASIRCFNRKDRDAALKWLQWEFPAETPDRRRA